MWALHRASFPLRNQRYSVRASCVKLMPTSSAEDEVGVAESPQVAYCGRFMFLKKFYHSGHASPKFTVSRRELSSQADISSTKDEDDLEDGFSELETPAAADGGENVLIHDTDSSDESEDVEEPQNELELSDTEIDDSTEKKSHPVKAESELFKEIISAPPLSVSLVLDKWIEEGKELSRQEISLAMLNLRKRKMYGRALQLSEWLESNKQYEFVEKDYASQLDLIAKFRGIQKAESYIESIPESFRGEVVYRTLLANSISQNNLKKAEEIFNKMKELEFPLTQFVCNQLLLLYKKRNEKKKIADVLLLMESENIKPSPFTYKLLIDAKGQSNDIPGMDLIVESMKAEGIEPDIGTKAVLVRHYISAGLEEKAETVLKEMEGENLKKNRWVCQSLLPLYAILGKADEVGRIWKICESNPRIDECLAAIEAWGKLKKIDEAEAVFEMISKKWKLSSKNCSVLLKVYANHKMVTKGKDLIKRMADSGYRIGPLTWDALVKLLIEAGDVEKADSILQKAVQQSQMKPLFPTYIAILEQYAKNGDIHNSEKIFYRLKQAGYTSRARQYQALMQAYVNAKKPAYGMRDRLKSDKVFPNRSLANLLVQVDGFRKNPVSDLLD
ncbi:PREDICTED: pentatricopeptide repeat-containing protein At1g80270, mitochondrial-like isoform X1 [Lupinus angustifolius]|uniref:pentatricopeptide repeat-containing protein At1g80270, mitochondrial-like isoform X1 n=1 Tax=Lupinus angustifolius TaxID=3871 RepID=UPI00092ED679|nr:PREDICTED: pentatricopeptide repeat-containing protein At1g80270, mitochondrial-like isoform X1 [Lupinus angustifolius]